MQILLVTESDLLGMLMEAYDRREITKINLTVKYSTHVSMKKTTAHFLA